MLTKLLIEIKEKTITNFSNDNHILTMGRNRFKKNMVTYKYNDKVIGVCNNKIINAILFNEDKMSMYSWYCLNVLIINNIFIKEGEFNFNITKGNPLNNYMLTDDRLFESYRIITLFNDIYDKLKCKIAVKSFIDTYTDQLLNEVFKVLDLTNTVDIAYANSLIIGNFVYNYYCNNNEGTTIATRYSYRSLQMKWLNNYINQEPLKWLDEKKCFTNREIKP